MPRFLHTADWQIGRLYSQFPAEDAVPLALARLTAVETIARRAVQHSVDSDWASSAFSRPWRQECLASGWCNQAS